MSSSAEKRSTQIDFGAVPDTSIAATSQLTQRAQPKHALQKRQSPLPDKRAKHKKRLLTDEASTGLISLATVDAARKGVSVLDTAIKQESPWDRFREHYKLNLGGFVSVASDRESPHDNFIIKRFDDPQFQMLQRIRHNNFHNMQQCFSYDDSYYAVFQHVPISLDHLANSPPYLKEHELAAILGQVCFQHHKGLR